MKVESHVIIGAATWAALVFHQPSPLAGFALPADPGPVLLSFPLVALGSLLPDLDHPHAAIGESWLLHPLVWTVSKTLHHRGVLHSLVAVLLVYLGAAYVFGSFLGAALAFGYLAHILADFLTVRGVPLFMPLSGAKLHLPLLAIHTGGPGEIAYLAVIVIASAASLTSAVG